MILERTTIAGDSPVDEKHYMLWVSILEYHKARETLWETGSTTNFVARQTAKAKYSLWSIVNKYREGKVKSSPVRAVK